MSHTFLKRYLTAIMLLFIVLLSVSAMAQENAPEAVVTDFLNVYSFTSDKVVQLVDAIPEDKFDWRPAEGIRSVKESVLHSTAANYFFGMMFGATTPEGVDPKTLEKSSMSKKEAIAALKQSVKTVQDALKKLSQTQLDEEIDFFGNKMSRRQTVFALGDHAAEHLGQLIAYARMNGVTPPWSKKDK